MENLQTFEVLVKLASFGTAGVCVLSVFIIGFTIFKLPNDTPEWKPMLLKKFINACIIIALITATSGSLNAYFNHKKVNEADKATAKMVNEYEKVATEFTNLQSELMSRPEENLNAIVPFAPESETAMEADTETIDEEILKFQPRTVEKLLDEDRYQRIRRIQKDQIR